MEFSPVAANLGGHVMSPENEREAVAIFSGVVDQIAEMVKTQFELKEARAHTVAAKAVAVASRAQAEEAKLQAATAKAQAAESKAQAAESKENADKKLKQFFNDILSSISMNKVKISDESSDMYYREGCISLREEGVVIVTTLNSADPVIRFLQGNPLQKCDFRAFNGGVSDMATLVNYFKQPDCRVNNVAFKAGIPVDQKLLLDALAATRIPKFALKYYP